MDAESLVESFLEVPAVRKTLDLGEGDIDVEIQVGPRLYPVCPKCGSNAMSIEAEVGLTPRFECVCGKEGTIDELNKVPETELY